MKPNLKNIDKINVLLLENISSHAINEFHQWGIKNVTLLKDSPSPSKLKNILKNFQVVGIRSRTKLTSEFLNEAKHLYAIGCFCIGTDQVDLKSAKLLGIPVFNAPYSNTRSVAEIAICHIISMFRQVSTRNIELHQGIWNKTSLGCYEIRGKTLGIIGYGHIGKQLGTLAENLGMKVVYYDIINQLSLGNVSKKKTLRQLLEVSDVVSLHIPETSKTKNLINEKNIKFIKKNCFLINLSRGSIIEINSLVNALKVGHIKGAAIDVFLEEPQSKHEKFHSPLQNLENVILTPHIAGNTEEAQINIGREVASTLSNFLHTGTTNGAVNFANIVTSEFSNCTRFIHIHKNVPGVLAEINDVFSRIKLNIIRQQLQTDPDVGFAIIDTELIPRDVRTNVKNELRKIKQTIRTYSIS